MFASAICIPILFLFKEQVHVLVCEDLDAAEELFIVPVVILRRRHDEARVDQGVSLLQLINIFN